MCFNKSEQEFKEDLIILLEDLLLECKKTSNISTFATTANSKIAQKVNKIFNGNQCKTEKTKRKRRSKKKEGVKIVLYGFDNEEVSEEIMKNFIEEKLEVPVVPKAVNRMGKSKNSPVLIHLNNQEERSKIFKNLKKLKKWHIKGHKYSFTNFMSQEELNNRKSILKKFYKLKENKNNKVFFKHDKLYVNGKPYTDLIEGEIDLNSTSVEKNALNCNATMPLKANEKRRPAPAPPTIATLSNQEMTKQRNKPERPPPPLTFTRRTLPTKSERIEEDAISTCSFTTSASTLSRESPRRRSFNILRHYLNLK